MRKAKFTENHIVGMPSVDTSNPAIDRRSQTGHLRRQTEPLK